MAATTAEKIAFHAANVARTAPRLEALCGRSEDAARRAGALAERIRRADDRRARLAQAIQAATDVLSLRDCAAGVDAAVATDDLETAAAHVAKFRLIEGAARAGGPALEGELEAMRRCTARVEGVVRVPRRRVLRVFRQRERGTATPWPRRRDVDGAKVTPSPRRIKCRHRPRPAS